MYKYVFLCLKRQDRRYLLDNFERQGDLPPLTERENQQINLMQLLKEEQTHLLLITINIQDNKLVEIQVQLLQLKQYAMKLQ